MSFCTGYSELFEAVLRNMGIILSKENYSYTIRKKNLHVCKSMYSPYPLTEMKMEKNLFNENLFIFRIKEFFALLFFLNNFRIRKLHDCWITWRLYSWDIYKFFLSPNVWWEKLNMINPQLFTRKKLQTHPGGIKIAFLWCFRGY